MSDQYKVRKGGGYSVYGSGYGSSSSGSAPFSTSTNSSSNNTSLNSGKSLSSSLMSSTHDLNNNSSMDGNGSELKGWPHHYPSNPHDPVFTAKVTPRKSKDYPVFTPLAYDELFFVETRTQHEKEEEEEEDQEDEDKDEEEEEEEDDEEVEEEEYEEGNHCFVVYGKEEDVDNERSRSRDMPMSSEEDGDSIQNNNEKAEADEAEVEIRSVNAWINPAWEHAIREAASTPTKELPTEKKGNIMFLEEPPAARQSTSHILGEILSEEVVLPPTNAILSVAPVTGQQDDRSNEATTIHVPPKDHSNSRFKFWLCRGSNHGRRNTNVRNTDTSVEAPNVGIPPHQLNASSSSPTERPAAVVEVLELRSAMGDMAKKLDQLELYCQDLKFKLENHKEIFKSYNAQGYSEAELDASRNIYSGSNQYDNGYADSKFQEDVPQERRLLSQGDDVKMGNKNLGMVSSTDKKTAEFFEIVSEARVKVRHFCKAILKRIQGSDKLEAILQSAFGSSYNYNLKPSMVMMSKPSASTTSSSSSSWRRKSARYHMEALLNQAFFQDFENIRFERNGTHCILDQSSRCLAFYKTFHGLRRLGWSEVLRPGSRRYSASFDRFCGLKMATVEAALDWEGSAWPEQAAQGFFVAARSVWLVHLLAFSFDSPATIFRVGSDSAFDPKYMKDLLQNVPTKGHNQSDNDEDEETLLVKVMVMPGFFVNDEILKCKVLCSTQPAWTPSKLG